VFVPFAIRNFRSGDFQRLWEIDQQCFVPGIAYTQMDLSGFLAMRGAVALVAEFVPEGVPSEGSPEIVAFIVAYHRKQVGRIITLDVVPQFRRHGLACRLMRECEQCLRIAGCSAVYLETAVNNEPALRLYQKLGYRVMRTLPGYYTSEDLDALRMQKQLT